MRISPERKESILRKLLDPENTSIIQLSEEEGISTTSLYNWRKGVNLSGRAVVDSKKNLSREAKFAVVVETATLSEAALSKYCRKKGLYAEEIKQWKSEFISGIPDGSNEDNLSDKQLKKALSKEKHKTKKLERELTRKEKALAEVAALMVLSKKADAIWGETDE